MNFILLYITLLILFISSIYLAFSGVRALTSKHYIIPKGFSYTLPENRPRLKKTIGITSLIMSMTIASALIAFFSDVSFELKLGLLSLTAPLVTAGTFVIKLSAGRPGKSL